MARVRVRLRSGMRPIELAVDFLIHRLEDWWPDEDLPREHDAATAVLEAVAVRAAPRALVRGGSIPFVSLPATLFRAPSRQMVSASAQSDSSSGSPASGCVWVGHCERR